MYNSAQHRPTLFPPSLTRCCARGPMGRTRLPHSLARQTGAVLIISMIILLIMTLIGVTAMNTTTLEEKMAGNSADVNLAFQAAEAALRDGEQNLISTQPSEPATCSSAPCNFWQINSSAISGLSGRDQGWWAGHGLEYGASGTKDLALVKSDPYYIVEYMDYRADNKDVGYGIPAGATIYRVTASGTGGADTTQVILQTTYVKRFN